MTADCLVAQKAGMALAPHEEAPLLGDERAAGLGERTYDDRSSVRQGNMRRAPWFRFALRDQQQVRAQ